MTKLNNMNASYLSSSFHPPLRFVISTLGCSQSSAIMGGVIPGYQLIALGDF
jgi:hypothetical protein